MWVLSMWTVHVLLVLLMLSGFTSCYQMSESENGVPPPNYGQMDEVKKVCASVISSATELRLPLIDNIRNELSFSLGDWEQEDTSAPLMRLDYKSLIMQSDDGDKYTRTRLPYKLLSFRLNDVSTAHQSESTVGVNGMLYVSLGFDLPPIFADIDPYAQSNQIVTSFQGIYAESENNGGERKLCLLGSTMSLVSDPYVSNSKLPSVVEDDQILLILNYPMRISLKHMAIHGEMKSLSPKGSLKYFDRVRITSQLKSYTHEHEFLSDEIISKAFDGNPYSHISTGGHREMYKNPDFCTILRTVSTVSNFAFRPHFQCHGMDEVCDRLVPFGLTKQNSVAGGGFKDVRVLIQNIHCEHKRAQDVLIGRVSAVLRAFDASANQYVESQRTGLDNMTLVSEGMWTSSDGQLCMIGCVGGPEVVGNDCSTRICLYVPMSFSIRQNSVLTGTMWNIKNPPAHPPLSLDMSFQRLSEMYESYRYPYPYYEYSEIHAAQLVMEKAETFSFENVISKSLFRFPEVKDSEDDLDHLRHLREDLSFHSIVTPDIGSSPWTQETSTVEMEILALGPLFGRDWISNSNVYTETHNHERDSSTDKRLLLNVSAQFHVEVEPYRNFSGLFLEGLYNPRVGKMYMIGCRDVRASLEVLSQEMDYQQGLDCLIEAVISYPPTNDRWLVSPNIHIFISSQRTEDDPLYFKPAKLQTSSIFYREQREDLLSRSSFEAILRIATLSLAIACILSQFSHSRKVRDSLPYMSLVMLGIQAFGYAIPLVISAKVPSTSNTSEFVGTSDDIQSSQSINFSEYLEKLLMLGCLLVTLRLFQKVWMSRIKLTLKNAGHPRFAPSDKCVVVITLIMHVVGCAILLYVKSARLPDSMGENVDALATSHRLRTLAATLQKYMVLLPDLFLLPQVIANFMWNVKNKPLCKVYYMGFTTVRLLPYAYSHISGTACEEFFSEYDFLTHKLDIFSEYNFKFIAIPVLATCLAVTVYIQQRLISPVTQLKLHPSRSRMYERLSTQSVETEFIPGPDKCC